VEHSESLLRILVVDDDPAMVGAITALVGTVGHQVVTAYDGETAVRRWREERPDVALLDLAMSGIDGYEVVRRLRADGASLPIIVVSGEVSESAKVRALDMGADDYLTKPFGKRELLARIRAAMRRSGSVGEVGNAREPSPAIAPITDPAIRVGPLIIDVGRHVTLVGATRIHLTPTEHRLLEALARAGGQLVDHRGLLAAGWPDEHDPDPLWLKPHLARLRRKVVGAGGPSIDSIRGVGWRLGA
jgi:two-component system KDP operon response regulator KdpE